MVVQKVEVKTEASIEMQGLPENSAAVSCLKNGNNQGFLRRAGKNGKTFALRRKRWYKLDGALFSKHNSESSEASWYVNIQGADIVQLGKAHFVLVLKLPEGTEANGDFEQNTLVLHAKTEEDCKLWVSSLKYAAQRKLENHYIIGQVIGEGGFAQVRIGKCVLSGEPRAIKTMRKNDAHAKLFGREIAIIKRVSHPNIVKTFDVYETTTHIHIVMEFLEGGMLYEAIEDGVRFTEADTIQFMRELIDGIYYLHRHGIVHRDIKPENVLCTSRIPPLHVKIADFGLSSISSLASVKQNQMLMSTIIGTPEFIAPEIANREEYTEKVDIWALGMLCYNVITGNLPLDETMDMIPQIRNGVALTFPEHEWQFYSPQAQSFVKALLCTDPQKRLSPLACLVHPWLEQFKGRMSSKIGCHGRVSKALLQQHPVFRPEIQSRGLSTSRPIASHKRRAFDAKRSWKIAFLSVSAANRFDWLINPRRYANAMAQLLAEAEMATESSTSERNASERMNSGRRSNASLEPASQEFDPTFWESDAGEAGSSSKLSYLARIQQEGKPDRFGSGVDTRLESLRDIDKPKRANTWNMFRNQAQTLVLNTSDVSMTEFEASKKQPLRKKIISAISQETEKRLAPVRKLSKRLGRIGEEKKQTSTGPSPLLANQFDMDLQELNVVSVDESDIQGLDDLDELEEESGPATYLGKKHKSLIKKSAKKGVAISPITPGQGKNKI